MKLILSSLIHLYQRTISPDHGLFKYRYPHGFCRFYPSCSEYTRLSILKFGTVRGVWLGLLRVLRCNPFAQPRVDAVNQEL